MRFISSSLKTFLACVFLLSLTGRASAQTQINPTSQIRWPAATGTTDPALPGQPCTAANYGQPYTNTATGVAFSCSSTGWVSVGPGALFPATPGLVANTSTTAARNATYGDIFALFGGDCTGAAVPQANGMCGVSSGGAPPAPPAYALQYAGPGATAFNADAALSYAPTTHTLAVTALASSNSLLALNAGANSASASDFAAFSPGTVGGVNLTSGGSYSGTAPTVTFSAPPMGGTTATGVAVLNGAGTAVSFVYMTNHGSGYVTAPTVAFGSGGAAGTATLGLYTNQPFPLANPYLQYQTVNRRLGPAQGSSPLNSSLFLLSGTDNTNVVEGDWGILGLSAFNLAPQQGGGMLSIDGQCYAVGDCVGDERLELGRGVSRQEDEGVEMTRAFNAVINDTAGGTLTAMTTDAQGAVHIATSVIPNSYSENFYEKSFLVDVTKKWESPGNVASIGTYTDTRFSYFQGDGTSGITAQYGVSTQTLLTAPVDNYIYTGACGSQTKTAYQYPISGPSAGANDGFMTNYQGVGTPGENTNYDSTSGALVGFCATVASTAGMAPGTLIFVADSDYQVEYTRVIAVVDGTHFTAFFRQPHSTNATVNFGGAVGYGIGADVDITPPGTNSTANNNQYATQRLVYPIVQSLAGDEVVVYTNTEGSSVNNLRSLLPAANTPTVPLTIADPVVTGGVLTGFTANDVVGNANNYVANFTGTANSGHPSFLPPPAVTISGCTVAPTLSWSVVSVGAGLTYAPAIATGGSGCATVTFTIATYLPTPFGVYPMAQVYKSEDQTKPAGVVNPVNHTLTDGAPTLMPFNTAAFAIGDEIMAPDWWNGQGTGAQTRMEGNYLHALDGRNGAQVSHFFAGVGNGFPEEQWLNEDSTAHYFGSFANGYVKTLATDYLVSPPIWEEAEGQYSKDLEFAFPPLTNQIQTGTISGGQIIDVGCAVGLLVPPYAVDPPCEHGVNYQYDIFRNTTKAGAQMDLYANPATNTIGVGLGTATFQAPTLTAYDIVQATTDVALMGTVNGGPGRGPCARYDLLLTSASHAYGQSYGRICAWTDHSGSSQGDLSFQTNDGSGTANYATPLLLNSSAATFSVPITSTVATGTAPFSIASTTNVLNLNASLLSGVALSGLCQTSGTGCPATTPPVSTSLTTTAATFDDVTVTGMTAAGHCALSATNGPGAADMTTAYIAIKANNTVRVAHSTTAGETFDLVCTPY